MSDYLPDFKWNTHTHAEVLFIQSRNYKIDLAEHKTQMHKKPWSLSLMKKFDHIGWSDAEARI